MDVIYNKVQTIVPKMSVYVWLIFKKAYFTRKRIFQKSSKKHRSLPFGLLLSHDTDSLHDDLDSLGRVLHGLHNSDIRGLQSVQRRHSRLNSYTIVSNNYLKSSSVRKKFNQLTESSSCFGHSTDFSAH